jgi:hypothetical protein
VLSIDILSRRRKVNPADLFDYARLYGDRYGWSCFPVFSKSRPAVRWSRFRERLPGDVIEGAFRRAYLAGARGVAVVLGAASGGLVDRDFDDVASYEAWAKKFPMLAREIPTRMSKRGFGVLFRGPEGFADFGNGEYRGDSGHYSVLPPSWHSGKVYYRWRIPPGKTIPRVDDPVAAGLLSASLVRLASRARASASESSAKKTVLLGESLYQCASISLPDREEIAVCDTLPTRPGERHHKILALVRRLRRIHPSGLPPEMLRAVIDRWLELALPSPMRTKDPAVSLREFAEACSYQPDERNLRAALADLDTDALPPTVAERCATDLQLRLAAVCQCLQGFWGDSPFFLAYRQAAKILGNSDRTAGRVLLALEKAGIIRRVKTGTWADRKATTWRFTDL